MPTTIPRKTWNGRELSVISHQSLDGCRCPYCGGLLVFRTKTCDNRCNRCGEVLVTEFEFRRRERTS